MSMSMHFVWCKAFERGDICISYCLKCEQKHVKHTHTQTLKSQIRQCTKCARVLSLGLANRQINRFDECKSLGYECVGVCVCATNNDLAHTLSSVCTLYSVLCLYAVRSALCQAWVSFVFVFNWISHFLLYVLLMLVFIFFVFATLSGSFCAHLIL